MDVINELAAHYAARHCRSHADFRHSGFNDKSRAIGAGRFRF